MANIKHNKYRNTGILFELLVRKITADTMSNQDSKAVSLIKKYFVNTELSKENKLYQSISRVQNISEAKAESIISTILEINKSLNQVKLSKEVADRQEMAGYDYSDEKNHDRVCRSSYPCCLQRSW